MSIMQELSSWFAPKPETPIAQEPAIGSPAPKAPKINLEHGKPTLVVFLRHCGCPFAEKTFLNLRDIAKETPDTVSFIAVSHSDEASTQTWLQSLPQAGSEPANMSVVVDAESEAYAAWGLGPSGWGHVLSPSALSAVWKLSKDEGISNRPTESGSRWQTSGFWAVDGEGVVRWGRVAGSADDIPDFEEAVKAIQ